MGRKKPDWQHFRIIHSKYPPVNIYQDNDEENFLLGELESQTSGRVINWEPFIDEEDMRTGYGWGAVIASFCYTNYGRFSTPELGCYYCASCPKTAIKEWSHHTAKTWRDDFGFTDDASAVVRCYVGEFTEELIDVREDDTLHDPADYSKTQSYAIQLRKENEYGILYKSVRNPGKECAALLRPVATTQVTQSTHYVLKFDGTEFINFASVSEFESLN
ncbi:RES family NAD+ phosphorylase [Pleionea mediterranea]|uniref:RES family NAD+ phosphorylase n=1 Tax=Pleionea mediterranea TaxID=523701 RepID=UPI0014764212|nr:RES family NAD+ phosphorylase [Pleionea mediterranea]